MRFPTAWIAGEGDPEHPAFLFFLPFFFWVGEGGEMRHAP